MSMPGAAPHAEANILNGAQAEEDSTHISYLSEIVPQSVISSELVPSKCVAETASKAAWCYAGRLMQCLSPKRLACMTLWDSLKRPLPLSKRVPRRLLSLLCTMEVIPRVLSCLAKLHLQTSCYIPQGLSHELCKFQKPFEVLQAVTSCSYAGASHSASPQKTTMFGKGLRAVLSPFGIRRFSGVFQASHAVSSAQMPAVSAYLLRAFLSARCATVRASQSG